MVTFLADTSAWIDYLRDVDTRATHELDAMLRSSGRELAMIEPIAMELLAGAEGDVGLASMTRLVDGLPSIPVDATHDFRAAAAIFRACRIAGRTVRNTTDCLIAAVAIRTGVTLVHKDVDFEVIQSVTPLVATSWR
jgi:predicted nucleic acid-binding protein